MSTTNNKTFINWKIHSYCSYNCSYCPSIHWGGEEPRHISKYLSIASKLIDHYSILNRTIDWSFDGGEPLEFFDFAELLKLCKSKNGNITLHTSGGKIWLDWWAISRYIDRLELTYHYWQNEKLIEYIISMFTEKFISVKVPIRPNNFDDDISRFENLKSKFAIPIIKMPLYHYGESLAGTFEYTDKQRAVLFGPTVVNKNYSSTDYNLNFKNKLDTSPSYTGKLCNSGIEKLNIGPEGWVTGSDCGNENYGNIFSENLNLPTEPQRCKFISCISLNDQQITKFD